MTQAYRVILRPERPKNLIMLEKHGYVYLMANVRNTVLYTGVTSDLIKRVYEHRNKATGGFTKKYNLVKLVHYEFFDDIADAILREKEIKGWIRRRKNELIVSANPEWRDLYERIVGDPSVGFRPPSGLHRRIVSF